MITVIILTHQDEIQIKNCISSISELTDDIVVVDSFSTDNTIDICHQSGARVYQNKFINQARQFNWALDNIPLKYDWVLRLDSDEIIPSRLKIEMEARIKSNEGFSAYYLNRRMYWMGRWLRFGRMYPHYIVRLFQKGKARYEDKTEEHLVVDGEIGYMKSDFLENNKKNHLEYFIEKHLITARGELDEIVSADNLVTHVNIGIEPKFFGPKIHRTRWLKEKVYSRIPLFIRPFIYFLYRYFFCLGFLDGIPGLIFHVLQGFWYRFYIDAKVFESRFKIVDEDPKKYLSI